MRGFYTDQRRRRCKRCLRLILVNKNGQLRRHRRSYHNPIHPNWNQTIRCDGVKPADRLES